MNYTALAGVSLFWSFLLAIVSGYIQTKSLAIAVKWSTFILFLVAGYAIVMAYHH